MFLLLKFLSLQGHPLVAMSACITRLVVCWYVFAYKNSFQISAHYITNFMNTTIVILAIS